MLKIEALPAEYGDSIWIEYGSRTQPQRILIDCGTKEVYKKTLRQRIQTLAPSDRHFEVFIVSHIDVDHIGGAIDFIAESKTLGVTFSDIWFNGYKQLQEMNTFLGALQAEELTALLEDPEMELPWNKHFSSSAVVVKDTGELPRIELNGGMTLTVLSPTPKQLTDLIPEWEETCKSAGIIPGSGKISAKSTRKKSPTMLGDPLVEVLAKTRFTPDKAKPNGTSIAVLAEYEDKRMLLAADAFAPVLISSLARIPKPKPLEIDVFKMAHHGSQKNTNNDLIQSVKCKNWIISTNGKKFEHPDQVAIARVIKYGEKNQTLLFNYRTGFNDMWDNELLKAKYDYATHYPSSGLVLEL
jgi:beta-lactamase superfamily II metal-dependent hydrolase